MGQHLSATPHPHDIPYAQREEVLRWDCTITGIANKIKNGGVRKIMLMSGAGMSVDAGIPDFRSPGTGLYDNLAKYQVPSPESIFELGFFKKHPKPFYTLLKELLPGKTIHPTLSHFFSVLLQEKQILLRHYTQNIDGLERFAGVDQELLVEAHGTMFDVHCTECNSQYPIAWFRLQVESDIVPHCIKRVKLAPPVQQEDDLDGLSDELKKLDLNKNTTAKEHSPSSAATASSPTTKYQRNVCGGLLKPDITFFGESLPQRFANLQNVDAQQADLLIILGTSLTVFPFASLISSVGFCCPRLLINKEAVGQQVQSFAQGALLYDEKDINYRDVFYKGRCDEGIQLLCEKLGWSPRLKELQHQYFKSIEADHRGHTPLQEATTTAEKHVSIDKQEELHTEDTTAAAASGQVAKDSVDRMWCRIEETQVKDSQLWIDPDSHPKSGVD